MMLKELRNAKDPMHQADDRQKQLFEAFAQCSNGFPADMVFGALANMFCNALRQGHPTLRGAENALDERAALMKRLLQTHYDNAGRRRNVFPFTQDIRPLKFTEKTRF